MKKVIISLLTVGLLVMMVLPFSQPSDVQARMASPEEPRVSVQLGGPCPADATITLDADAANGEVVELTTGHTASVPVTSGATYTWTLTGDYTNLSGATTRQITWDASAYSTGNVNIAVTVYVNESCQRSRNVDVEVFRWYDDCTLNCTASSTDVVRVWLSGDNTVGTPLGPCTPGNPVTAYLWVEINNQAAARDAAYLTFDRYEDDVWQERFVWCLGTLPAHSSPAFRDDVDSFSWTCGVEVELRNILISWATSGGTCGEGPSCPPPGQCWRPADIIVEAPLVADFDWNNVCYGTNTQFTDTTTGGATPYTYSWGMGGAGTYEDGTSSTSQNPHYHYNAAGTYTVTLTVTDNNSTQDSQTHTVTVYALPTVGAGDPQSACEDSADFALTGGTPGGGTWSGDHVSGGNFDVSAAGAGSHEVTYTYTDANGCSNHAHKTVTINALPTAAAGTDQSKCADADGTTTFSLSGSASGGSGSGYSYAWSTSDSGVTINSPSAKDTTVDVTVNTPVTITLTVSNGNSCQDTDDVVLTAYALPTATASNDGPYDVGDTINLTGGPGGMTTYSWTGPDGYSSGAQSPSISGATLAMAGTYTLTVTNENGCTDTADTVVTVTTPPSPPPGGGGIFPVMHRCYLDVDMLGEITTLRITCCGDETYEDYLPTDPDEVHFLVIESDTPIFCGEEPGCGDYPEIIVMSLLDDPPSPPEGMTIVGSAYDWTGYLDEEMLEPCSQVTFGLPCTLILGYDPDELPEGAFAPVIAYYDEEEGVWVILPPDTGRVAEVGQVTGIMNYIHSSFAVLAELPPPPPPSPSPPSPPPPAPPPSPAHFVASGLTIMPSLEEIEWGPLTFVVREGGSVTVTANVGNDGGQEGSYVANLLLNGQIIDTQEVTLSPGQSQMVVFSIPGNEPGSYVVQIGDLGGEFQTWVWINWWLIGGLTAAFVVGVWAAWYYGYRRRRLKGRS